MTEVSSMPPEALDSSSNGHLEFKGNSDGLMPSSESGSTGEIKANSEKLQTKTAEGNKPSTNGDVSTPKKSQSKLPGPAQKNSLHLSMDTAVKSPGTPKAKSLPKTPESVAPQTPTNKKLPMNKIQVGAAPSPNLKAAKSKVGSLANTTHKPGGGNIRIESHKLDFSKTHSRIEAKNDQYVRSGGDKKIPQVKLQWEAKSKVGSLENSTYKPGGGDKKIESLKLDFKEKAKPKVGSKDNVKHVPGGGTVKIESQKLDFKAQSKVGSLDNVKHKPGGGEIKIFDDKTYLKQISATNSEGGVSGTQSFGDLYLHAMKESGRRSVPGTPGPKTRVKIRKTSTIRISESMPLVQATEVSVATKNPLHENNIIKSQSNQGSKLTISKVHPAKTLRQSPYENTLGRIKIPVNDNEAMLVPNLGESKENKHFESLASSKAHEKGDMLFGFIEMESKEKRENIANAGQNYEHITDGKSIVENDSDSKKFMTAAAEMEEREKIEKNIKKRNIFDENILNLQMEQLKPQQDVYQSNIDNQLQNYTPLLLSENSLHSENF